MKTAPRITLTAVAALVMGITGFSVNAQSQQPSQGHTAPQPYGGLTQQKIPAAQHPTGEHQPAASENKAEPPSTPAPTTPSHPMPSASPQAASGVGPDHKWERGTTVAKEHRTKHYVVSDWKGHGLKKPARGQEWIQHGSDYILINNATGKIVEVHQAK